MRCMCPHTLGHVVYLTQLPRTPAHWLGTGTTCMQLELELLVVYLFLVLFFSIISLFSLCIVGKGPWVRISLLVYTCCLQSIWQIQLDLIELSESTIWAVISTELYIIIWRSWGSAGECVCMRINEYVWAVLSERCPLGASDGVFSIQITPRPSLLELITLVKGRKRGREEDERRGRDERTGGEEERMRGREIERGGYEKRGGEEKGSIAREETSGEGERWEKEARMRGRGEEEKRIPQPSLNTWSTICPKVNTTVYTEINTTIIHNSNITFTEG